METAVRAESDGEVAEVLVRPGQAVEVKDLLVVLRVRPRYSASFRAIAGIGELRRIRPRMGGDQLARGHLVLGAVDAVDRHELAAAQIAGTEAARGGSPRITIGHSRDRRRR